MPEIKHTFAGAKMNKDTDERVVINGQYRDALNIQIATSDGSNVGSAQNILGNTKKDITLIGDTISLNADATCCGVVASDSRSSIYSFISSPNSSGISKDYIFEFDTKTNRSRYAFVDIYNVNTSSLTTVGSNVIYISDLSNTTVNITGVRVGMYLTSISGSYTMDDNITVTNILYDTGNGRWAIYVSESVVLATSADILFIAPRVLNFPKNNIITGINVLDDTLFWTDNFTEPKRINIPLSIAGTGGDEYLYTGLTPNTTGHANLGNITINTSNTSDPFLGDNGYFHTRLTKRISSEDSATNSIEIVTDSTESKAVYVEESHITVIRKAPTQPLKVDMFRSSAPRINSDGVENPTSVVLSDKIINKTSYPVNSTIPSVTVNSVVDFRVGDIVLFYPQSFNTSSDPSEYAVRTEVVSSNVTNPNSLATSGFGFKVLSIVEDLPSSAIDWTLKLEDTANMFEFRFPRFSYRYIYENGEYSTFAPWSEIAFLTDDFEYLPKKGYNLGMVNQLRSLKLKEYHPANIPSDVVAIDILYKETNKPTVYSVKTIKPTDAHPMWPDLSSDPSARGEFNVKTDMVHAVVPSDQLLRPWDNVPRKALSQEISANRLIYGNYLQNYSIIKDPLISVSVNQGIAVKSDQPGAPSVKSLRDYQVGVVFSDGYGRETPVITSEKATANIPISAAAKQNRLEVKLDFGTEIPSWARYFAYYVKEASTEYYTLAMDRWYNAADGNIWLSFPSSERNKLDEETFLYLKKTHGTDNPVKEKVRYKILAIENEAPDFIKTKNKVLGTVWNSAGNNDKIGDEDGGYLYSGFDFVTVVDSDFHGAFGDDFLTKTPDSLTVRFSDGENTTINYKVDKVSKLNNDKYRIQIENSFGTDVEFASEDGTWDGRIDNLSLEMSSQIVENKPEFDGRFFAKVFKDKFLDKYVLSHASDHINYVVDKSWNLKYINNNGYSNVYSQYIPFQAKELTEAQAAATASFTAHPTQYSHLTSYNWGDSDTEVSANNLNDDPIEALNGNHSYAKNFWEDIRDDHTFFIDACTAYSWTSKSGNQPGNEFIGDRWSSGGGAWQRREGAPYFGGADEMPGSMKDDNGMPSRGIWSAWGEYSNMDISWSGMGGGYTGGNWNDKPFAHRLQNLVNNNDTYSQAGEFIMELVEPGTKFRFRLDPDHTIYTVHDFQNDLGGYGDSQYWENGADYKSGAFGIRNFRTLGLTQDKAQYKGHNMRQRWTLKVSPPIGSGSSGYSPTTGTSTTSDTDVPALHHDGTNYDTIEILVPQGLNTINGDKSNYTDNPAVWETEPKDSVDLDLYYQASGLIPLELNNNTNEEYIPIGSTFKLTDSSDNVSTHTVTSWDYKTITFTPNVPGSTSISNFEELEFTKRNNYSLTALANGAATTGDSTITLRDTVNSLGGSDALYRQTHRLDWNNCWSFGNGVESDRARDDFNENQVDNGVKVSSVLAEDIKEDRVSSGLIWSGLYNSLSGINNTNQFLMADKITKNLNPSHGSIQRLLTRDNYLVMFCEDKVLRAVTDKDALYNADGKPQLVASHRVVGDVVPYRGDYGISRNPESLAITPNNAYFTDIDRGQVLALSVEGVRSISDIGMRYYFSEFKGVWIDKSIGTYDNKSNEYNVTIKESFPETKSTTVSYNERSRGWVSFKSFALEQGISLDNDYYTFENGYIWKHHVNPIRNNFYGTQYNSSITLLFNEAPGSVKSFGSINYEGSQAKITEFDTENVNFFNNDYTTNDGLTAGTANDGEFFNLNAALGWYVDSIKTNLQDSGIIEFKDKEGKWFGYPTGVSSILDNIDTKELTTQGLGTASIVTEDSSLGNPSTISISDSSDGGWD